MRLIIKKTDHFVDLNSNITAINIENGRIYRELALNFNENIEIYDGDNLIDITKMASIISNPFQISLNEKKMLISMYKDLNSDIHDEERILVSKIEQSFIEFMDKLVMDIDYPIDYNETVDTTKLFQAFEVKFQEVDTSNYIELLISYIKLCVILCKSRLIFTFNLLSLLSIEEYELFLKEIELMDVYIVDFGMFKCDNINVHYIDSDWFII